MEFVIVLPIYFVLIGTAFVVGELSLHSIHLVSSADRGMALVHTPEEIERSGFESVDADVLVQRLLGIVSLDREHREVDYSYAGDSAGGDAVKVSNFDVGNCHVDFVGESGYGSYWTKAVAGGIVDDYALTPLSRGFVAHWYHLLEQRVYGDDLMSEASGGGGWPSQDARELPVRSEDRPEDPGLRLLLSAANVVKLLERRSRSAAV